MNKKEKITVFGMGYVGLPLAVSAGESGFTVIGIDIDSNKIDQLKDGTDDYFEISRKKLSELIKSGSFIPTTNLSLASESTIAIVCVPTPLDKFQKPDLQFLLTAVQSAMHILQNNGLLIIESTIETGTSRNVILPILEEYGSKSQKNLLLAYSPERIDPNNRDWDIYNTPKLVAGTSKQALKQAVIFYSKFVRNIIECKSLEVAETAKLLENIFRLVNISLINEILIFCNKLGIEVLEVIEAASTKPYGFMPFYPGMGAGGHCIPIDPMYFANKAKEINVESRLILLANQINRSMPSYFADLAENKLGSLLGKKILVLGVAYKADVPDVRESPCIELINILKSKGALVAWHDELVKEWQGESSSEITDKYDLAILATPHKNLRLEKLGPTPILHTKRSIQ